MIAAAHFFLARSFESLGNYDEAIEQYQMFLQDDRDIAGGDYISATYDEILDAKAKIYRNLSRYEEAIANYRALLIRRKQTGDEKGQALVLTMIAEIYSWIGDSKTAIQSYKEALELFRKNGDRINEINVLSALGEQVVTGEISAQESSEYFATAEKLLNSVEGLNLYPTFLKESAKGAQNLDAIMHEQLRPFPPLTRMAVGNFYQRAARVIGLSGNRELPGIFLSLALVYHGITPPFREATIELAKDWYFYAELNRQKKLFTQALEDFRAAESLADFLHSPEIHWVYTGMARTYQDLGDYQTAIAYYKKGLAVLESIHQQQGTDEVRIGVFAGALYAYGDLVPLLLKLYQQTGDERSLEDAFQTTESLKARAFREMFALSTASHQGGELGALATMSEKIRLEMGMIKDKLERASVKSSEGRHLLDRLEALQKSLNNLNVEQARENPAYSKIFSPAPVSLDQVKQSLPPDTAILEYTINDQQIVLWAITNEAVHYALLAKTEKPILQDFLKTLREPLTEREETLKHIGLGQELYRFFLEPVEEHFKDKKRLIIVPDGDFYYLPFEALIESHKELNPRHYSTLVEVPYLIKRYEISYASSATVLLQQETAARNKKARPRLPLIAFGDPIYAGDSAVADQGGQMAQVQNVSLRGQDFKRLEFAAEEVKGIASVWNISPASENINVRERASVEQLKKLDLSKYHILHFATHAVLGDKVSLASQPALVLSQTKDGGKDKDFLQLADVLTLKLNADLVVLSACETGLGQFRDGEGILGLTRGFFYAGASSAVVSLWKVEDQSTALLMEKFYQRLKSGQSRADAIRQAKLDVIRSTVKLKSTGTEESLSSPFFWAPFILVGDPGPIRFD
jgi:CHAT domain-containing protein